MQVMVRKDTIEASALCLYRKPEAAQPERPLFIEAPTSDAPDEVRRPAWCVAWCMVASRVRAAQFALQEGHCVLGSFARPLGRKLTRVRSPAQLASFRECGVGQQLSGGRISSSWSAVPCGGGRSAAVTSERGRGR
jgi:hypothetical protein